MGNAMLVILFVALTIIWGFWGWIHQMLLPIICIIIVANLLSIYLSSDKERALPNILYFITRIISTIAFIGFLIIDNIDIKIGFIPLIFITLYIGLTLSLDFFCKSKTWTIVISLLLVLNGILMLMHGWVTGAADYAEKSNAIYTELKHPTSVMQCYYDEKVLIFPNRAS